MVTAALATSLQPGVEEQRDCAEAIRATAFLLRNPQPRDLASCSFGLDLGGESDACLSFLEFLVVFLDFSEAGPTQQCYQ